MKRSSVAIEIFLVVFGCLSTPFYIFAETTVQCGIDLRKTYEIVKFCNDQDMFKNPGDNWYYCNIGMAKLKPSDDSYFQYKTTKLLIGGADDGLPEINLPFPLFLHGRTRKFFSISTYRRQGSAIISVRKNENSENKVMTVISVPEEFDENIEEWWKDFVNWQKHYSEKKEFTAEQLIESAHKGTPMVAICAISKLAEKGDLGQLIECMLCRKERFLRYDMAGSAFAAIPISRLADFYILLINRIRGTHSMDDYEAICAGLGALDLSTSKYLKVTAEGMEPLPTNYEDQETSALLIAGPVIAVVSNELKSINPKPEIPAILEYMIAEYEKGIDKR